MDFQVSLENMKRENVQVGNTLMHKDLYLIERLLPTLIEGLEQLSREVENLMNDESTPPLTQTSSTLRSERGSTPASSWPST